MNKMPHFWVSVQVTEEKDKMKRRHKFIEKEKVRHIVTEKYTIHFNSKFRLPSWLVSN